ncbi:hypothetical protein SDC9_79530 [bioreactor metagenome]|uniref:Uncharacterized protein n=1 Tax=bioreactor metagenome TaxID=1076179 RepID=A0A644Z2K2_9ZZZZ
MGRFFLGFDPFSNVLHLRNKIQRCPVTIPHQYYIKRHPDNSACFFVISFYHLKSSNFAVNRTTNQFQVQFNVVSVGNILEFDTQYFFLGIANHIT